jgi:hypothetical protein
MSNRSICVAVLLSVGTVLLTPQTTWSYNNDGPDGGPHRKINEIALDRFIQAAAEDPILRYYDFSPSLVKYRITRPSGGGAVHSFVTEYYTVTQKGDWYAEEATAVAELAASSWAAEKTPSSVVVEEKQPRPFPWWIVEGGFTADEPELHMSLRHFYDPYMRGVASWVSGNTTCSYLTDITNMADNVLFLVVRSTLNPCVDAKRLALKESQHSWSEGQTQLKVAFDHPEADARRRNAAFGKAWRCLGETMHLLADMTTPAHVRNDGHPEKFIWAGDPYEAIVSAEVVQNQARRPMADGQLAGDISSCLEISRLFDLIATYTNTHYFSNDTISGTDYPTTLYRPDLLLRRALLHPEVPPLGGINTPVHSANGQPDYDSPKLDPYFFRFTNEEKDDSGTYMDRRIGGRPIVHRTAEGRHVLDVNCIYWQTRDLIPVAVAANMRAIDLFLPRFGVKVDEFDRNAKVLKCHVVGDARDPKSGKFSEAPTTQFPGDSVQAVVFVTIGKEEHNSLQPLDKVTAQGFEVKIQPVVDGVLADYLKDGGTPFPADGISLAVGLDMGGILIKSEPKPLPALRIDPKQVRLKTKETQRFTAQVVGTKDQAVEWKVKENGGGTIDPQGGYVAPPMKGTFHVVAASKTDKTATDVATVQVEEPEKKEVPPPPALTADISWRQAVLAAGGIWSIIGGLGKDDYHPGDVRHGFVFQGTDRKETPGKPLREGWCKDFDHGVVGRSPYQTPYWLYYEADLRADMSYYSPTASGPNAQGEWPSARESCALLLKSDKSKGYEPVPLGDVAVARTVPDDSNARIPDLWECCIWRGPFWFSLRVRCRFVTENRMSFLSELNGTPDEGKRTAMCAQLSQVGMAYAKAILDSFEVWYRRPIAAGPSVKGLYWPLHISQYRLQQEDLPAGSILGETHNRAYEWYNSEEQYVKSEKYDETETCYNPGACTVNLWVSYPEERDTAAEAPLIRAQEAMGKEVATIRGYFASDEASSPGRMDFLGPNRLALPGADDAVEMIEGYKEKKEPYWRPSWQKHWVIARRANVWIVLKHEYVPKKTMTPSAWVQKLAEQVLAKLAADKPAPPAPASQ